MCRPPFSNLDGATGQEVKLVVFLHALLASDVIGE
jgi:hypothetical protein